MAKIAAALAACRPTHGLRQKLAHGAGITRERLESFDRPIKVEPEDYPDKRDALISEFRNYLGILNVRSPSACRHCPWPSQQCRSSQSAFCACLPMNLKVGKEYAVLVCRTMRRGFSSFSQDIYLCACRCGPKNVSAGT